MNFAVECYGQGETQSISQKAQTDPAALLEYLDRFIDIAADLDKERALLDEVLTLQSQIEKAAQTVERIPQVERNLALKKKQLDALEKAKAKEVISLIRKLEAEKQVRISIQNDIKALTEAASHDGMKEALGNLSAAADPASLRVGKAEYEAIITRVDTLSATVAASEATLKAAVRTLTVLAEGQLTAWRSKARTTLIEIEEKKQVLAVQNIHLDMAYINRLTVMRPNWRNCFASCGPGSPPSGTCAPNGCRS